MFLPRVAVPDFIPGHFVEETQARCLMLPHQHFTRLEPRLPVVRTPTRHSDVEVPLRKGVLRNRRELLDHLASPRVWPVSLVPTQRASPPLSHSCPCPDGTSARLARPLPLPGSLRASLPRGDPACLCFCFASVLSPACPSHLCRMAGCVAQLTSERTPVSTRAPRPGNVTVVKQIRTKVSCFPHWVIPLSGPNA